MVLGKIEPKNVATSLKRKSIKSIRINSGNYYCQQRGYKCNYNLPSIKLLYGVLAMANAGPQPSGSQIFIITKKEGTDWLNGLHTGFGKVIEDGHR